MWLSGRTNYLLCEGPVAVSAAVTASAAAVVVVVGVVAAAVVGLWQ